MLVVVGGSASVSVIGNSVLRSVVDEKEETDGVEAAGNSECISWSKVLQFPLGGPPPSPPALRCLCSYY